MKRKFCSVLLIGLLGASAISSQEVLGLLHEHIFYAYFSGTGRTPTDREIDGFIETVRPQEFRNFRRNEFEWRRLRQEGIRQLTDGIANFNSDTLFVVLTNGEFGGYDFDRDGFEFRISNNFTFNATFGGRNERFTLLLTNNREFDLMEMDADTANQLIQSRTLLGMVDRSVRLQIFFRFADFAAPEFVEIIEGRRGYFIHGLIERIDVLDYRSPFDIGAPKIGEITRVQ